MSVKNISDAYYFMSILLLIVEYLYICRFFSIKYNRKNQTLIFSLVFAPAYAVFCVFITYFFRLFFDMQFLLVILFMIVLVSTLVKAIGFFFKSPSNPWSIIAYGISLGIVYYMTLGNRGGIKTRSFNLIPFVSIAVYSKYISHSFFNILLFFPVGFLLSVIYEGYADLFCIIPSGYVISLLIESIQLLTSTGKCDVDDIIFNTLGCALGIIIGNIIIPLFWNHENFADKR